MQKKAAWAAEIWTSLGGRGDCITRPIPATVVQDKGLGRGLLEAVCDRPFIYFDLTSAGGPGRAHAKLPRRAMLSCPLCHLNASPSVSREIYVCSEPDLCERLFALLIGHNRHFKSENKNVDFKLTLQQFVISVII